MWANKGDTSVWVQVRRETSTPGPGRGWYGRQLLEGLDGVGEEELVYTTGATGERAGEMGPGAGGCHSEEGLGCYGEVWWVGSHPRESGTGVTQLSGSSEATWTVG